MSERKEVTFYRGAGNHSVYELEKLMAEREEFIYQTQLKFQKLQSNFDAVVRERDGWKTMHTKERSLNYQKDAEIQRLKVLLENGLSKVDMEGCLGGGWVNDFILWARETKLEIRGTNE